MSSPSTTSLPTEYSVSAEALPFIPKTQVEEFSKSPITAPAPTPRLPSLRSTAESSSSTTMTASSTPLGTLKAARRPGFPQESLSSARAGELPQDMQAKMKAFHLSRQGAPSLQSLRVNPNLSGHFDSTAQTPTSANSPPNSTLGSAGMTSPGQTLLGGCSGLRLPPSGRPSAANFNSAPAVPNLKANPKLGLAAKRGLNRGMKLSEASKPASLSEDHDRLGAEAQTSKRTISTSGTDESSEVGPSESLFAKYSEFVDTESGSLKFKGKATIHGKGIDFSSGTSFSISLDEVDNLEELGKGNYGTVYRVRHSRPYMRRLGLGVNSIKQSLQQTTSLKAVEHVDNGASTNLGISGATMSTSTGIIMAMKEIRLELDEAKFAAIIMELDILHRCVSPFIIDFYGAFFQEGAVYICMEYMDGGSIDKLYYDGMPERILRKITMSTIMGLKVLKDDHNIIHRDVKPTNILVNTYGQVKICDFGVSGNLVASIAKTNIGCQSYMAPERIVSGGIAQSGANASGGTYSVQSDIWSLGLSIIECSMGQYPYPPETYNNIFSQLSVDPSFNQV